MAGFRLEFPQARIWKTHEADLHLVAFRKTSIVRAPKRRLESLNVMKEASLTEAKSGYYYGDSGNSKECENISIINTAKSRNLDKSPALAFSDKTRARNAGTFQQK